MRFGPRHHEQRKRRGHQAVGCVNRAPRQPGIVPPLLQRAKHRMQDRRHNREIKRNEASRFGPLDGNEPFGHARMRAIMLAFITHKRVGKFLRVEGLQVVDLFAHTNGMDRQAELVRQSDQNTALGSAVQFGHHKAGHV